MTHPPKILPANTDDPRFQADPSMPDRRVEWTASDALMAKVTDPIDQAETIVGSRFGVAAIVEGFVTALGEMISSLIDGLLSHWSPH